MKKNMAGNIARGIRREWRDGLLFAAKVAVIYFVLAVPLAQTGLWQDVKLANANILSGALDVLGFDNEIVLDGSINGNPTIKTTAGLDIELVDLCSGGLEAVLMAAFLLATPGVAIGYKLSGIFISFFLLMFFNTLRIIVSALVGLHFGFETGELFHSVFFRLFLFLFLVGYYYHWAKGYDKKQRRENKNKNNKK